MKLKNKKTKPKKDFRKLVKGLRSALLVCLILGALGVGLVLGIDAGVRNRVCGQILTEQEAAQLQGVDCIVVFGCKVYDDGSPSAMLEDRLKRGVALYQQGAAPKLLMSGDHGRENYDEVDTMKHYAVDAGIASEDVFMDHAGFSTYETLYRAKEVFGADKIIVVTQDYHLYRALYVAQALGIEAYGVGADYRQYYGQEARDAREILARVKDFAMTVFKPEPTYLGETIPISGSGELTHDENSDFS